MSSAVFEPTDLFSLDVEGEGFVPETEEEFTDCSINIKPSQAQLKPSFENTAGFEVSSATYVRPLRALNRPLTSEETKLCRQTILHMRRCIYSMIANEDFCVSCDVAGTNKGDMSQLSDISDTSSDSPMSEDSNVRQPSPSATTVNHSIEGSRKASRLDSGAKLAKTSHRTDRGREEASSAEQNPKLTRRDKPTGKRGSSQAGDHCSTDVVAGTEDGGSAAGSAKGPYQAAPTLRLTGMKLKRATAEDATSDRDATGADTSVDATADDAIKLTVSTSKLSNAVTDIEHTQMSSSVPFPRFSRSSRGNMPGGLSRNGRRYFFASDGEKLGPLPNCHMTFLAHLYRRKRSVCFFCGFVTCPRTSSPANNCPSMRCSRCSFKHKWGRNQCKDKGDMVKFYHRTSDWRQRRENPWSRMPKHIRAAAKCFYCGKPGEANFRCRGISCPKGADTLEVRCLELLGKKNLDRMVRQMPLMFTHLRDRHFEFR
ncbi:hypothetical protein, conserved [Babesia bigemina]|uniref:Uncharacterized protein n=1 Tax=Babesia bigemina TaxID=5866 RepID=A0A061D0P6_BABBI|nr:hypothetical protein, conserved [Babesia bigemina]CDR94371.1 hypothetical protein, conserved [Babesia bigemina]|eukprot:XP_012766557.1 hypothetical protein, conserved [Babesia bigemina]